MTSVPFLRPVRVLDWAPVDCSLGFGRNRPDRGPFPFYVATHGIAPSFGMNSAPEKVEQYGPAGRGNQETVHNNTKKQSDTSNE